MGHTTKHQCAFFEIVFLASEKSTITSLYKIAIFLIAISNFDVNVYPLMYNTLILNILTGMPAYHPPLTGQELLYKIKTLRC